MGRSMRSSSKFDVAIVGGGMVGASLALALSSLPIRVVLLEKYPPDASQQPSFDERATALANATQRIYTALGCWADLATHATPINSIHISDQGRFGFARIRAEEEGVTALGFMLENRVLGEVLWRTISARDNVQLLCPAEVEALRADSTGVELTLGASQYPRKLNCALLVAADGAGSRIRSLVGVPVSHEEYRQSALIANIATQKAHDNRAFERFTASGPLAVLPMSGQRSTIVWTLSPERCDAVHELDDERFLAQLQAAFGYRLGSLTRVGKRAAYPLALTRASRVTAQRCVFIGNAAHGLHPVAGQGFNLGLRDVAALAELLADGVEHEGSSHDAGCDALLSRYADWRRSDQRKVVTFTHALVKTFSNDRWPTAWLRDLGLLLFDVLPGAKSSLARHSMGLAGRVPRLAMGEPLA